MAIKKFDILKTGQSVEPLSYLHCSFSSMTTKEPTTTHLDQVRQNQRATADARAMISQLQQAIADQHAKANALCIRAAEVAAMEIEREDLLADIATGQSKAAELAVLDETIAQRKGALSEQGNQAAIEQTVAGLTRRLERTQIELDALKEARTCLMRRLLKERAEAVGGEYVSAMRQLRDLQRRLMGLSWILADFGQVPGISMNAGLQVPSFALESVRPHATALNPSLLVDTSRDPMSSLAPTIQAEKAALRAIGVNID